MGESDLLVEAIRGLREDMGDLRGDIRGLRAELDEVKDDQGNLRVTVAHMEGVARGEAKRGESRHRARSWAVDVAATVAVMLSAYAALFH